MDRAEPPGESATSDHVAHTRGMATLRLYVARSTPNSVRAEANLSATLVALDGVLSPIALEIIDVFAQPKRARTDGVIVTPTLIGLSASRRILLMGDLADRTHLASALTDLCR